MWIARWFEKLPSVVRTVLYQEMLWKLPDPYILLGCSCPFNRNQEEARLCTLSDQIDKIIQLLFIFFNAFPWEMEEEWNATKVQRLCLDRMWSNGLLAGSGLFPSTSIMFIRLRTTSRSGAESRENNHCIRSLACCISIVPHLIAYFDLRQLL